MVETGLQKVQTGVVAFDLEPSRTKVLTSSIRIMVLVILVLAVIAVSVQVGPAWVLVAVGGVLYLSVSIVGIVVEERAVHSADVYSDRVELTNKREQLTIPLERLAICKPWWIGVTNGGGIVIENTPPEPGRMVVLSEADQYSAFIDELEQKSFSQTEANKKYD